MEKSTIVKRLLLILAIVMVALGAAGQPRGHTSTIKGSLKGYKYVYIVPPSDPFFTATLTVGRPAKKVILSELAKDFYSKLGYKLSPQIDPKLADKTLVVSYGRERHVSSSLVYSNGIFLQVNDAKTGKALAVYATDGLGSSATEELVRAFHNALDLFYYTLNPKVVAKIIDQTRFRVELRLTNQTPYYVDNLKLRLAYYDNGKPVCEQVNSLKPRIIQGEAIQTSVKRTKKGRNTNYEIKAEVIEYK